MLRSSGHRPRLLTAQRHNRIGLLVLTLCFNLAVVALIEARQSPLSDYEPDIYSAIPPAGWIAIFAALSIPVGLFWYSWASGSGASKLTKWLVTSFIVANCGLQLIPWARYPAGYDRWDSWYHLAEVNLITQTGHFSVGNVYPAIHLLAAAMGQVSGTPPVGVFAVLPTILGGLTLATTFVACRLLGVDHSGAFAGVVGMSVLLTLPIVLPLALSVLFLVLIIGVYFSQRSSVGYLVIFLVALMALVLSHLLTAISLLVGLISIVSWSQDRLLRVRSTLLLSSVIVATWVFWMTRVYLSPVQVIARIVATGTFAARDYAAILAGVGLTGFAALVAVLEILLPRLGMVSLSIPSARTAIRDFFQRRSSKEALLGRWAVGNLFILIILGSLFGSGTIGDILDRFINYGLLPVVFLSALATRRWWTLGKRAVATALVILLVVVFGHVVFYYPSPITYQYNWEAGSTDIAGLSWIGQRVEPGYSFNGSTFAHAMLSGLIGESNASTLGLTFGSVLPKHLDCPGGQGHTADFVVVTSFDLYVLDRRGDLKLQDLGCALNSGQYDLIYSNGAFWTLARPSA